jgi:hypothetical protein
MRCVTPFKSQCSSSSCLQPLPTRQYAQFNASCRLLLPASCKYALRHAIEITLQLVQLPAFSMQSLERRQRDE